MINDYPFRLKTTRNGGSTRWEECFLGPFVQRQSPKWQIQCWLKVHEHRAIQHDTHSSNPPPPSFPLWGSGKWLCACVPSVSTGFAISLRLCLCTNGPKKQSSHLVEPPFPDPQRRKGGIWWMCIMLVTLELYTCWALFRAWFCKHVIIRVKFVMRKPR